MALQPIHRRYGYGAARLPIGMPPESIRLSECAQRRSDHERLFALVPGLLCVGLAFLLSLAASLDLENESAPMAAVEPTTIDIESWEPDPRLADMPPPADTQPRIVERKPEPTVAEVDPMPAESEPIESPPKEFDLGLLAMAPTRAVPTLVDEGTSTIVPREIRRERRPNTIAPSARLPLETLEQIRPAAASLAATAAGLDQRTASSSAQQDQRPTSASDSGAPRDVRGWTHETTRDDFLAALGEGDSSAAGAGSRPSKDAARPHVAAAAAIAMGRDVRDRVRQQARRDGWYEVPLDELPACSPPERQDQLKKRILLATTAQRARECSHPDGQYRFLETRNLNAFLMWSRTNPESAFAQRPARDVCDVLERALVCLEGASTKDLGVK